MSLANLKRLLTATFIAVAVFLSACGGGGGSSGGSDGTGGDTEPLAYRAAEPVVAMESLVHFDVGGLEGSLLIADADGSEYQVLSDGVMSAAYYSVGSQPQFKVSVQPANQHCEIDAGTLYAVPSHDDFIQISCLPLLIANPAATYLPGQMIFFGLTTEGFLTGEVQGHIDGVHPIDALVWDGILGLMMPVNLPAGVHTLELTIGGREITHTFELAAPLEMGDAETYIVGELDRIQEGLEALLPTADTQGQSVIQSVLSAISQMRDILPTLSPEELLDAAYFLAANNPSNAPVAEPAVSLARVGYASKSLLLAGVSAKSTFDEELCLEKAKLFAVEKNAIAFLVGVGVAGLGATDILLTMSAGAGLSLGAALPALLAIAAGGAIVYRALEASLESALTEMLDECINWQAILEWFGLSGTFSERSLMLSAKSTVTAKSSSLIGESIKHISLVHGEEKSIHLWAKRTVPPAVESLIRKAQQELMPVSGIFDEILEPLYPFEFTKVLPVADGSVSIVAFHDSGDSGGEYPETPQEFSMTFLATVTDGAEAPEFVELPVRGSLYGNSPIIFNDYHLVPTGEVLEGAVLPADYARSYRIVDGPDHGELLLLDSANGVFNYRPVTGFSGLDSFTFTASNAYGDAQDEVGNPVVATVTLSVDEACTMSGNWKVCKYVSPFGLGLIQTMQTHQFFSPPENPSLTWEQHGVMFSVFNDSGHRVFHHEASRLEDHSPVSEDNPGAGWILYGEKNLVSEPERGDFGVEGLGDSRVFARPAVWNGVEGSMRDYRGCGYISRTFQPFGGSEVTIYHKASETISCPGAPHNISPLSPVDHFRASLKVLLETVMPTHPGPETTMGTRG